MKHRVIFRKLGRKTSHRTAMLRYISARFQVTLRNLTTSLIEHDRFWIGTDYARQRAAVTVKTDAAMEKLFDTIAGRYKFSIFLAYYCF